MERETLRAYMMSLPETAETLPFGPDVWVYKVAGKMFALLPHTGPVRISLKCDPDEAPLLRERYPEIEPGYHLNKQHWNTVQCDGALDEAFIEEMIIDSYVLVVKGVKKADHERLLRALDRWRSDE